MGIFALLIQGGRPRSMIYHLSFLSIRVPGNERRYLIEDNLDIFDRLSCQRGWLDVSLLIMVMMRIGIKMLKFLLIVPAQKWHLAKELVGVVNVSLVVIDSNLEIVPSRELCPDFKEKMIGGKCFCLHHGRSLAYWVRLKCCHQNPQKR